MCGIYSATRFPSSVPFLFCFSMIMCRFFGETKWFIPECVWICGDAAGAGFLGGMGAIAVRAKTTKTELHSWAVYWSCRCLGMVIANLAYLPCVLDLWSMHTTNRIWIYVYEYLIWRVQLFILWPWFVPCEWILLINWIVPLLDADWSVSLTRLTLVWCSGLLDPFSMYSKWVPHTRTSHKG